MVTKKGVASSNVEPWWDGAIGYEIYVRSFADASGDGIGDLAGVESRLEYLQWLGIDALWITPFYPSPGLDHGYDVSDYCSVDPKHGTLKDFDRMVAAAHRRGLRVVIDLVLNHTSSQHPWFVESIVSTDSPKRDFYVWRDPAPDGGPPNNWVNHFGGPAWTLDEASNQYYCHLFLPEQPDLNWANPEVRNEVDKVMRFWCNRGVDGFRLDQAHALSKHPEFPDNPRIRAVDPGAGPTAIIDSFEHRYDMDQDANAEIHERWNALVRPYGVGLFGEVNTPSAERIARFSDGNRLHRSFFLRPGWTRWDPVALLDMLISTHEASPDHISWVSNNHDQSRSPSRFGGGERGRARSRALTVLLFALGGTPFLYYGEELALDDAVIASEDREDPIWTRNGSAEVGRDVCREVMPWSKGHATGFTTGEPWLRSVERPIEETVEFQREDPGSPVHWYRDLIRFRQSHPGLWAEPLSWLETDTETSVALARGPLVVVANLGETPATVVLEDVADPVFESLLDSTIVSGVEVTVRPETSVVLRIVSAG